MSVPQPAHCLTAADVEVAVDDVMAARPAAGTPLPTDVISTCKTRSRSLLTSWPMTKKLVSNLQEQSVRQSV